MGAGAAPVVFRRIDNHIAITLPITIGKGVSGGKVTAPSNDGPVFCAADLADEVNLDANALGVVIGLIGKLLERGGVCTPWQRPTY